MKQIIELDLNFFKKAVDENIMFNGGSFSDWEDADHIIDTYTSLDEFYDYIYIEDKEEIKKELNIFINEAKTAEEEISFSLLKINSYGKVKYEKKDFVIMYENIILEEYKNKSAYEVIESLYKDHISVYPEDSDELFFIKNDLVIRQVRKGYDLHEIDMACIRKILENTIKNA
jgi:hypothetical protein